MATRQVVLSKYSNGVNNATQYLLPTADAPISNNTPCRAPYAFKLKQIGIETSVPAGSGNTWTYDVLKNGSTCGMQIVITGAAQTTGYIDGNVSFGVDDTIIIQRVPTSAPDVGITTVTWVWDMTQNNQTCYLNSGTNNATQNFYNGALGFRAASTAHIDNPSPVAGTITKAKYNISTAPTAGKNYVFTIYKNDIVQDGTSGSVDTRVTIADSATSGEWSGTLTVAQGDDMEYKIIPTGTPPTSSVAAAFGFTPTTDGESCFGYGGTSLSLPTSASTNFTKAFREDATSISTTEATFEATVGGSGLSFSVTKLYWGGVLSVSNSPVLSMRRNQADPSGAQSITMSGTSGNDVAHSVTFATGDEICFKIVIVSSPGAARNCATGLAMFAKAQAGKGAGKGNRGGGGVGVQVPGGATSMNVGNAGVDIEGLS